MSSSSSMSSPSSMSFNELNSLQCPILSSTREVRYGTTLNRGVSLGQFLIYKLLREFWFNAHSSSRDTTSSIYCKVIEFNLEIGEKEEVEEEGSKDAIAIICCKASS